MRILLACLLVACSVPVWAQNEAGRRPVPDAAAREAVLRTIAGVYRSDYEQAKTSKQKQALAKKLLKVGIGTTDDPTGQYVLFRIARDIAIQQGDWPTAFECIDRLAAVFEVDPFQMKYEVIKDASKIAKGYLEQRKLALVLSPCVEQAIDEDRFEVAGLMCQLGHHCAEEGRDPKLAHQIQARLNLVQGMEAAYQEVLSARKTLEDDPGNPEASSVIGKYLCLLKGDWSEGLKCLAAGSEGPFKSAAELEQASEPDATLIADKWWDISEGLPGLAQTQAQLHAAGWYHKAMPTLSGLTKARVSQRLDKLPDWTPPEGQDQKRYAIRFDGVESYGVVPSFRYDGKSPITIEAWILCSKQNDSLVISTLNGNSGIGIGFGPNYWLFRIGHDTGLTSIWSHDNNRVQKDRWTHVAGVLDGRQVTFFVDGTLSSTRTLPGNFRPTDAALLLGATQDAAGKEKVSFEGALKELRISNSVKYTQNFTVPERLEPEEDTLLFLPFEEGKGIRSADTSGKGGPAKLIKCEWE